MRCRGFSLIELMVTIAVLAILLSIGLPSFRSSLQSNRLATASNELIASLNLARSEAIRNTRGGAICPSTSGTECDGADWGDGWIIWADENEDGAFDSGEEILRVKQASNRLTFGGNSAPIAFDSRGRRRGSVDIQITVKPSDCSPGRDLQRRLNINAVGQIAMSRENCG